MIGGFAAVVLVMCLVSTPSIFAVTWEDIHPGGGGWCMGVFPHPNDPNRVWMTGDVSGMHASRDGGETWVHDGANIALEQASYIGPLGHKNQLAVDPSAPSYVYLAQRDRGDGGYKKGLWRSTDTGTTWEHVNTSNSKLFRDASITVDWNGVLFGVQHGTKTALVSMDHGATIIAKSTLPMIACSADRYTNSMVVKASRKNWIYLSDGTGNTKGLYYTTNRGDSWDSVSVFSDKYVIALGCSPTDGGVVVALTKSGDIYKTTDGRNFSKRFSISTKGKPPRIAGGIDINAQGKATIFLPGASISTRSSPKSC